MDKILLIDGYNALWRATYSFGPKPTSHSVCDTICNHKSEKKHCLCGANWNEELGCIGDKYLIVYNFFRNLRPIIEQFSPDKCFFVLEGHSEFRYALYPEYKANRIVKYAAKQEDMARFNDQRDEIIRLLQYFNITLARASNFECDDVISTLCHNMKDEDLTVLSNDSDFIQLLQAGLPNCKVYNPVGKKFMEAPTYHYVAWKSLAGDTSDNIPSLMGDKTAQKLLANPDKFQEFMAVEENRANFTINRQLIEFQEVPYEEIYFTEGKSDWLTLKQEFAKMEFQSIINDKSWTKYTTTFDCLKL